MIGHSHAWLILSHLCGQRIGIVRGSDMERIDLALLSEVGGCPHALRRPDVGFEARGIFTHQIAGYGEVVCNRAGIVEPITFSLFRRVSEEGPELEGWIRTAVEGAFLALLARLDIALRETAKLVDDVRRPWAERVLSQLVSTGIERCIAVYGRMMRKPHLPESWPASSARNFYVDESGNSGDLANADRAFDFGQQPVFALVGIDDDDALAVEFDRLRARHRIRSREVKSSALKNKPGFVTDLDCASSRAWLPDFCGGGRQALLCLRHDG
ncbi:hypothetical protein ACVIGB_005247 [Bradyrhizobium sp. USDA 4341]